ncbi:virB8 family protein [Sphingobium olei]|uniref:VirB8 family protein n=1 Tax=Sphingobium olei TaxID=420955 RepID=A0ABW3P2A0_9SPHN
MNDPGQKLSSYLGTAESWATDREAQRRRSLRIAWLIAGVATATALVEGVAIIALAPLKTIEPYTLLVDRQTGYVQALKPLDQEVVAPDRALTRSFLAQYVLSREGFDVDSLKNDYRKVALWSAGDARARYIAQMQATNSSSPLATLPRRAVVTAEVRGISSLGPSTALVRFVTVRTDPGGRAHEPQPWQAVISYRFSSAGMSAGDRLDNPLGFQVVRYRRDAEIPPRIETAPVQVAPNPAVSRPVAVRPSPRRPEVEQ